MSIPKFAADKEKAEVIILSNRITEMINSSLYLLRRRRSILGSDSNFIVPILLDIEDNFLVIDLD